MNMKDQSGTHHKLLEEISLLKRRIQEMEQSESEKRASLERLSAGIAHELKNPLNIILQGIAYIQSSVKDKTLIDACDRIKKSAIRADMVIENFLSFSQQVHPSFGGDDMNFFLHRNPSKKEGAHDD